MSLPPTTFSLVYSADAATLVLHAPSCARVERRGADEHVVHLGDDGINEAMVRARAIARRFHLPAKEAALCECISAGATAR